MRNRKVYLDYTKNPFCMEKIKYEKLSCEAYEYLDKAGVCFGTPIERLVKMNAPSVELYKNKGVDLTKDYLEIALCAQHNNGGIAVDMWWQTSVRGLFAAGECAGTHGVTRPGGSALNAGQVGAFRAALYISEHGNELVDEKIFSEIIRSAKWTHEQIENTVLCDDCNVNELISNFQRRMSDHAAVIRKKDNMIKVLNDTKREFNEILSVTKVSDKSKLYLFYKLEDIIITQMAVLTAMIDYADTANDTRGSSLYVDEKGELREGLEEIFRFCKEKKENREKIQEIYITDTGFQAVWRRVRPLPKEEDFFENIWYDYRRNKNIY